MDEAMSAEDRFQQHIDEHRCPWNGGFAYCDEAMRLFRQLPPEDQYIGDDFPADGAGGQLLANPSFEVSSAGWAIEAG